MLNDFAIEQLKNKAQRPIKSNNLRSDLDRMVTKKPTLKEISRQGSTSTISTFSSLDSTMSSNTSLLNENTTFKSAKSVLSGHNTTISSLMTSDNSYKSTNSRINQWNLNGTFQTSSSSGYKSVNFSKQSNSIKYPAKPTIKIINSSKLETPAKQPSSNY